MEKVKEWLIESNKDQMWLANKLGITTSRLSRILSGKLNIKLSEAMHINQLSRGKVKLKDFVQGQ